MARSLALVFGGTGTVGREVLRGLAQANMPALFTYHRSEERAKTHASDFSQRPFQVDLAQPAAIRALFQEFDREGLTPDVFIHCAAVSGTQRLEAITESDWQIVQAVNGQSALIACQELAARWTGASEGHIVLVGALDRSQSLPLPIAFAASQGMLSAMTMALAKELGPRGVRVNLVALGVLEEGLSRELDPRLLEDYRTYSALRRAGTAAEAARPILWLALENTYMNGKVLAINGGI